MFDVVTIEHDESSNLSLLLAEAFSRFFKEIKSAFFIISWNAVYYSSCTITGLNCELSQFIFVVSAILARTLRSYVIYQSKRTTSIRAYDLSSASL